MNVLHIDEQRGWRGGEQQASYLIQGLAERGHTLYIAGRKESPYLKAEHGGNVAGRIALPFKGEADLYTVARLASAIKRYNIDIVHAHTSHSHTTACLAVRIAGRGKAVVSRRVDFVPKSKIVNRWKYGLPDHYVAISGRIAGILREFGVAESKVSLVHSGIDPARLDVTPLTREELGVPNDAYLIGNVAALAGHKDHATLIDAMARLLAIQPRAFLVIAGDGPLRSRIESAIAQHGIGDRVRMLGYFEKVPALLKALDCFVMSSNEEGLGTSVLDAMAAGVPVVATAAGGIPEMVRDGETGLLVPVAASEALAGAIARMINEPEFARRCAANARVLVHQSFTARAMVEGNIRVYEQVLQGGGG